MAVWATSPTATVTAESPKNPFNFTPMSSEMMSPALSARLEEGMPCTTSSLIDAHKVAGYPAVALERRHRTTVTREPLRQPVQIHRRRTRRDGRFELREDLGHELVGRSHPLELRRGQADDHPRPPSTAATADAMSAATASAAWSPSTDRNVGRRE